MKKIMKMLPLLFLSSACLASCFGPNYEENSRQNENGDTLMKRKLYGVDPKSKLVTVADTLEFLFKKGGDVPYVSLTDGFRLMKVVRVALTEKNDADYRVEASGDTFKATNELNATVTFDRTKKTVSFSDFHSFVEMNKAGQATFSITAAERPVSTTKAEYHPGKALTLDLAPFPSLDIYKAGNEFYVPLELFNDLIMNNCSMLNISYNFQDFFLVPHDSLSTTQNGSTKTALGEKFYGGPKKETVSTEYARYYYDSLVFDFNNFYGLKAEKQIRDFDAYFTEKGYKEDMLSGDVRRMDNALIYALSWLNDGHTTFTNGSSLYAFGSEEFDRSKLNPDNVAWLRRSDSLRKSRGATGEIAPGVAYNTKDNVAFVTFDAFTVVDPKALYASSYSQEALRSDPNVMFASLYKDLTTNSAYKGIDTVVVDITCNDGGAADCLALLTNYLVGAAKMDCYAPIDGAQNRSVFASDLNLDGKVDSNDKGLVELGYNVALVQSNCTFSSANALSYYAKANSDKIIAMGERSGGGACVVRAQMTAIGSSYQVSGLRQLGKFNAEYTQFTNNDSGVEAKIPLNEEQLFQRGDILRMLRAYLGK